MVAEWAEFLRDEDFEDQFSVEDPKDRTVLFAIRVEGERESRAISFDDSGVEDWAFVALLPQLDGMDPRITRTP